MHGRLKVKTTAQQEAERNAEKAEKVKAYTKAMTDILDRRDQGVKDQLQLKTTGMVLMGNPDISTLWNIRKQVLEHFRDEKFPNLEDVLKKELDLTQTCLMNNPKSYGSWHHRCWCLQQMESPDWEREIAICNKYLSMDERNFHCWDYRRFVTDSAKVSAERELDYTMERINVNFSNYSSWHYRSKLLPLVYPAEDGLKITEPKRLEELDLIQNAAFTDPEDSSAWFYHTWLLGRPDDRTSVLGVKVSSSSKEVSDEHDAGSQSLQISVVLSKGVKSKKIVMTTEKGQVIEHQSATSLNKAQPVNSNIWSVKFNAGVGQLLRVSVEESSVAFCLPKGCSSSVVRNKDLDFSRKIPESKTLEVLETDLKNCQELLELEPDSKWTRLSMILVMQAIGDKKYHGDIIASLDKLKAVDPSRKQYYDDLQSKVILEHKLDGTLPDGELDLTGLGLTRIAFPERLCIFDKVKVDSQFQELVNCYRLNVED